MQIKAALPMPDCNDGRPFPGGFLLGTGESAYLNYIRHAWCMVLERNHQVSGFGILLPDRLLRESELWEKRNLATWLVPFQPFESLPLCYFEQLAFLPGQRRMAVTLAYQLIKTAFQSGCQALFTTLVKEPVRNTAALPFLKAAGAIHAGYVDEVYPVAGPILSDIYILERSVFELNAKAHPLYEMLENAGIDYFPAST